MMQEAETPRWRRRVTWERKPQLRGRDYPLELHIQSIRLGRSLHDEAEARLRVLAHQLAQQTVGLLVIIDHHPQERALLDIERGLLEHLGHHLAQALEALDVGPRVL